MVYFFQNNQDFSEIESESLLPLLDEKRRQRVRSCKSREGQWELILGFLLLRYALLRERGITRCPEVWQEEGGKPRLSLPGLHFNLSHHQGGVACCLSDAPVGVDVMKITPVRQKILDHAFSPEERRSVSRAERPDEAFTAIWTRKEAFGKESGKGLFYDLKATDLTADERGGGLRLKTQRLGEYYLSVCAREEQRLVILSPEELKRAIGNMK